MLRQFAGSLILALGMTTSAAAQDHAAMIHNAMSAAPDAIAKDATIVDGNNQVLRAGTNGWVCMPDNPAVPNNSPMCLDAPWLDFIGAMMSKQQPRLTGIAIAYMLQGDMPVSNMDPFATAATADNQWIENSGPHIMIALPDAKHLEGLSTDPKSGGPFVMWKGTPYAHIMIPAPARAP